MKRRSLNRNLLLMRTLNATPGAPLYGCENDGKHMRDFVLSHDLVTPDNIVWLKDKQATRQGFIDLMLDHIIPHTYGSDDGLLISLVSGHGSRDRDQRGEGDKEADGYTEFQVPYDYSKQGYWSDDQLAGLYGMVNPTWRIRLWNDCCHSGDSLRAFAIGALFGKTRRKVLPEIHKSRASLKAFWSFLSKPRQPLDSAQLSEMLARLKTRVATSDRARVIWSAYRSDHFQNITTHPNILAVHGCLANQYSLDAEINNVRQGAMSGALWETWSKQDGSWLDVVKRANRWLEQNGYGSQTINLEASNRDLFEQPFLIG